MTEGILRATVELELRGYRRIGIAVTRLFDTELLGFAAYGDEASGLGEDRDDPDGLAPEFRPVLLFDGREERVEVEGEVAEWHRATIGGEGRASTVGMKQRRRALWQSPVARRRHRVRGDCFHDLG